MKKKVKEILSDWTTFIVTAAVSIFSGAFAEYGVIPSIVFYVSLSSLIVELIVHIFVLEEKGNKNDKY